MFKKAFLYIFLDVSNRAIQLLTQLYEFLVIKLWKQLNWPETTYEIPKYISTSNSLLLTYVRADENVSLLLL